MPINSPFSLIIGIPFTIESLGTLVKMAFCEVPGATPTTNPDAIRNELLTEIATTESPTAGDSDANDAGTKRDAVDVDTGER